jgi:hypothetical protein
MGKREARSQQEIGQRYFGKTALSAAAYVAVLIPAIAWLNRHPESSWRIAVALLPLLPILYGMRNVLWYFRNVDELHQRIQLEGLALAFGGTAALVFTYGFLEVAGFPRLSVWWVWLVMGSLWGVGTMIAHRRYG